MAGSDTGTAGWIAIPPFDILTFAALHRQLPHHGGSIVSIANMTVPWRGWLVVAALLAPVAFVVSGIGMWLAYDQSSTQIAIGLVALPWVYAVIFVLLMLVSFKS